MIVLANVSTTEKTKNPPITSTAYFLGIEQSTLTRGKDERKNPKLSFARTGLEKHPIDMGMPQEPGGSNEKAQKGQQIFGLFLPNAPEKCSPNNEIDDGQDDHERYLQIVRWKGMGSH